MKKPVQVLPEVIPSVQQMRLAEHGGLPGIRDEALLDASLASDFAMSRVSRGFNWPPRAVSVLQRTIPSWAAINVLP